MFPVRAAAILAALYALAFSALAQQPAPHDVEVFGQKIHYLEAGAGPVVILLHGLGGDSSNWMFTVPALAKKYRVLVPDQIGFGASDKPLIEYRVQTLVDFLDAFCQKLNIGKAAIVGNSLGGWTAAAFALEHPEKVDKLVLVDAAGYSPARTHAAPLSRETLMQLNPSTLEGTRRLLEAIFANRKMLTGPLVEQLFAAHLKKGDGYTISQFVDSIVRGEDMLDGKLGGIHAPTLVVWGQADMLVPLAAGKAFAEDIAGARTDIIPDCGHVPQMECAGAFNAGLLEFLDAAR